MSVQLTSNLTNRQVLQPNFQGTNLHGGNDAEWMALRILVDDWGKVQVIPRLFEDNRGVTAIEYALIAALIAVAAIAAFTLVGTNLSNTFSSIANQL